MLDLCKFQLVFDLIWVWVCTKWKLWRSCKDNLNKYKKNIICLLYDEIAQWVLKAKVFIVCFTKMYIVFILNIWKSQFDNLVMCLKIAGWVANNVDHNQMLKSSAVSSVCWGLSIWIHRVKMEHIGWLESTSTLVIWNSKGPSEILRDICTSTYQICRIEEKIIRTTTFNKYICVIGLLKLEIYWKYCGKEEKLLIFYLFLDFHV